MVRPTLVGSCRTCIHRSGATSMPLPADPRTVAIVTLGCGRNEVDSANAAGLLAANGYRVVDDPDHADAVIVNTCAFIEAAKRESIETVLDAAEPAADGRAPTVLVMGCLAERYTEALREVAWLAGQGVSEVCLVAENSTSYGKDLGGREAMVRLLRDLAEVEGLRRVRLNYLQPDELTPGLLQEMG